MKTRLPGPLNRGCIHARVKPTPGGGVPPSPVAASAAANSRPASHFSARHVSANSAPFPSLPNFAFLIFNFAFLLSLPWTPQAQAASAVASSAPIRVAIISEQPAALPAADLLTVKLSGQNSLQLLERAEIDKVYREQALSAANRDYVKLGQVLGANGVVLLSPLTDGTNQFLQARLVAVGPGVIIGSLRFPWPLRDAAQWADWVAQRFEPLLPKLTVLARDAIPISIVNLRAAARSREGEELERQLTPLAIERLSREREFFVLERQRMELLTSEKDLRGASETAFWNGSHLLDGVLDRDGYSKDTVTLNARLTPAQGGAPVLIDVSGSRTNLSEVLDRLVQKIRESLRLGSPGTPWNAAEEAAAYEREAQWAMRWGMFGEAQSACESSWALGRQTKEVAELRIRAYAAAGIPPHSDALSTNPENPAYAPDPARLAPAIRAFELYQQGFRSFAFNEPKPDTNWYSLAVELLNSELLRQFNYYPQLRGGQEPQLATLRSLSRETVALLQNHPLYDNLRIRMRATLEDGYSSIMLGDFGRFNNTTNLPVMAFLRLGACWYETPEEALAAYREIADSPCCTSPVKILRSITSSVGTPRDQRRAPALWQGFINELCVSTNALKQVEGCFLRLADAQPPQQLAAADQLFKCALDNALSLKMAELQDAFVHDLDGLIASPPNGFAYAGEPGRSGVQSMESFRIDFRTACVAAVGEVVRLQAMTNYLAAAISSRSAARSG